MHSAIGENPLMAYLAMMAVRLVELHRVLKETGSLYLHCDPTASHYLKLVLDAVFGAENFATRSSGSAQTAHNDAAKASALGKSTTRSSSITKSTWTSTVQSGNTGHCDDNLSSAIYPIDDGNWPPAIDESGPAAARSEPSDSIPHYEWNRRPHRAIGAITNERMRKLDEPIG